MVVRKLLICVGVIVLCLAALEAKDTRDGCEDDCDNYRPHGPPNTQHTYSCNDCFECECHHNNCPSLLATGLLILQCSKYGHFDCQGRSDQAGKWTHWTDWECRGNCSHPVRQRFRYCSNPKPNCGSPCSGTSFETDNNCTPASCAVHVTDSTTRTAVQVSSTTAAPTPTPVFTSCSKLCSVSAVANKNAIYERNTRTCPGNSTGSSEALPVHCCHGQNQRLTRQGVNVMASCATFPTYTAIAAFKSGTLHADSEGIFIGCLAKPEIGFQLIRQDCNHLPSLVHVNTTQTIYGNPNDYFALF